MIDGPRELVALEERDLVRFLRGRYDLREQRAAAARAVAGEHWQLEDLLVEFDHEAKAVHQFLADHDPAATFASLRAARRLLDELSSWPHQPLHSGTAGPYPCSPDGSVCGEACGVEQKRLSVLRLLALPFEQHPLYCATWRP